MGNISYTAHVSNKKSAITSKSKLAGVAKHNLRKYKSSDYSKDNIFIVYGTSNLIDDVKTVYHKEFDEALEEYNKKQTRPDRRIEDYFEHVAGKEQDMAVEIIIQIGDREFWKQYDDMKSYIKLSYEIILGEFIKRLPGFVVANAVVHLDEDSPHMHIVGVPVADGYKKGLSKQVSKRKVFTKEVLSRVLQDELREAQEILDTFNDRKAAILYKAFQGNLTKQWRKEHSDISAIEYLRKIEKSGEDFSKKEFKFWESNELPKTWAESKIGNLLYFAGRIGWKGLKADEYTEEGPLLLSVYNLNDGDEVSYNRVYHITTERYEESPEIMVEIGDVLLTKDGAGIGKLGYVKELPQEATINSSLLLIRPGNTAISKYIFYLLSGPELQSIVKERITGSATPHLFQRDIKEFTIPIPPLEEQEEIVRILDDALEKEKIAYESAENVISQIELMKKSILAKAFRGELGTNNPEEESSSELLKSIIEGEK